MQFRITLALSLILGTAAFATSRTSSIDPATTEPAVADTCATEPELEAQAVCLPRQCGRVPVCTGNSQAVCSPETGCSWVCVPITPPSS